MADVHHVSFSFGVSVGQNNRGADERTGNEGYAKVGKLCHDNIF
jgi:hypothetical protein